MIGSAEVRKQDIRTKGSRRGAHQRQGKTAATGFCRRQKSTAAGLSSLRWRPGRSLTTARDGEGAVRRHGPRGVAGLLLAASRRRTGGDGEPAGARAEAAARARGEGSVGAFYRAQGRLRGVARTPRTAGGGILAGHAAATAGGRLGPDGPDERGWAGGERAMRWAKLGRSGAG